MSHRVVEWLGVSVSYSMAGHLPSRGFKSLPESLPFFSHLFHLRLYFSHYFQWLWPGLRSDCQVWSTLIKLSLCASCFALASPSQSNMPARYRLWLDPWQLSLKHSNSATEFPSDSVAQLVRAWQAIWPIARSRVQVTPWVTVTSFFLIFISHLSVSMTLTYRLRSDCQDWSMLKIWACATRFTLADPLYQCVV